MKILFILPWVPYPLDSGGNQAFFNMLDKLRQYHKISLVLYTHSSAERKAAEELGKVWNDVEINCYNDKKSSVPQNIELSKSDKRKCEFYSWIERSMQRKKSRILRKYEINTCAPDNNENKKEETGFSLGGFVKENSTLFRSTTDLNSGFLEYIYDISRKGFDMVQVEFFEYLPLVYILPDNVRKVFVHHELRFIRNENEMSLFNTVSMFDGIKFNKLKDEEISSLRRYDDIIVLTEIDKGILSEYLPEKNIYVSPALTSSTTSDSTIHFEPAKDLVFVGGGGHFPNADGMLWFSTKVAPILKEKGFSGEIFVTGKWGDAIQNIIHDFCPEIKFAGFVDDIHQFINGKITIVPIRIGSGMRMKIMDAMSSMSPMVTTSKGCEGIELKNGVDCFINDSPEEFADSIIKLITDVSLQQNMAESIYKQSKGMMDSSLLLQRRMDFYKP